MPQGVPFLWLMYDYSVCSAETKKSIMTRNQTQLAYIF
jgi:hypothetical protein